MIRRILALACLTLAFISAQAQVLSSGQQTTVRAFACADTDTARQYVTGGDTASLRSWLNTAGTFKVWRTNVSRADIYNSVSAEGTTWSWTFYKNQSAVEQNAWVQMFMGDQADFSQNNLRAGIAVIFTSASAANATHALAVGKRVATRVEQALATGTGSTGSPGKMTFEGALSEVDVAALVFTSGGQLIGC